MVKDCPSGKILREGYYAVRRGRRVYVPPACVTDTGAKGKTPKSKRWFKGIEGNLAGWTKDAPADDRRRILTQVAREDSYSTTVKRLTAIANVTADAETKEKMRADAEWLKSNRARLELEARAPSCPPGESRGEGRFVAKGGRRIWVPGQCLPDLSARRLSPTDNQFKLSAIAVDESKLDDFEVREYRSQIASGRTPADAVRIMINTRDGDFSQLSPYLESKVRELGIKPEDYASDFAPLESRPTSEVATKASKHTELGFLQIEKGNREQAEAHYHEAVGYWGSLTVNEQEKQKLVGPRLEELRKALWPSVAYLNVHWPIGPEHLEARPAADVPFSASEPFTMVLAPEVYGGAKRTFRTGSDLVNHMVNDVPAEAWDSVQVYYKGKPVPATVNIERSPEQWEAMLGARRSAGYLPDEANPHKNWVTYRAYATKQEAEHIAAEATRLKLPLVYDPEAKTTLPMDFRVEKREGETAGLPWTVVFRVKESHRRPDLEARPFRPWEERTARAWDGFSRGSRFRALLKMGYPPEEQGRLIWQPYQELPESVQEDLIREWRMSGLKERADLEARKGSKEFWFADLSHKTNPQTPVRVFWDEAKKQWRYNKWYGNSKDTLTTAESYFIGGLYEPDADPKEVLRSVQGMGNYSENFRPVSGKAGQELVNKSNEAYIAEKWRDYVRGLVPPDPSSGEVPTYSQPVDSLDEATKSSIWFRSQGRFPVAINKAPSDKEPDYEVRVYNEPPELKALGRIIPLGWEIPVADAMRTINEKGVQFSPEDIAKAETNPRTAIPRVPAPPVLLALTPEEKTRAAEILRKMSGYLDPSQYKEQQNIRNLSFKVEQSATNQDLKFLPEEVSQVRGYLDSVATERFKMWKYPDYYVPAEKLLGPLVPDASALQAKIAHNPRGEAEWRVPPANVTGLGDRGDASSGGSFRRP